MKQSFGAMIREARKSKKLTMKEVKGLMPRYLALSYMTKIERHGEIPSPELIVHLASILGLNKNLLLDTAYH
jgi:transcriptional regulator with XRE-family HTH domain